MKKYCLIIILSVLFLSGCEDKENVAEYVYMVDSPLTVVTTVTEVPIDTYSEYMETYTPLTTTGTDVYYYHLPPDGNVHGGMGSAAHIDIPPMDKLQIDSAMLPEKASRPDIAPVAVTTAVPEETTDTDETVTATPSFTMELPEMDKIHIQTAPADTAPTKFVPETTTEASPSSAE